MPNTKGGRDEPVSQERRQIIQIAKPSMSQRVSPQTELYYLLRTASHAGILCMLVLTGCQTTGAHRCYSPPAEGLAIRPGTVQPFSPEAENHGPALATAKPGATNTFQLSPTATVRGQSGDSQPPNNGWRPSTPTGSYYAPQQSTPPLPLYNPGGSTTPAPYAGQPPINTLPPPSAAPNAFGTGGLGTSGDPSAGYGATVAPGVVGGQTTIAPGSLGYAGDPLTGLSVPAISAPNVYQPRVRVAPLDVYLQEARTGRVILGGSVNSDLGVAGQLIIDERNFDIAAFPRSWSDLFSGYAFRGAGQSFRAELMPGNQVERYTVNWATPNMFGYLPYSLSVGGFLFTRNFRDWTEERLGGRVGIGYAITKDLSINTALTGENVRIRSPRVTGVPPLDDVLGRNEMYTARFSIARDTRDSPFLATEGSLMELIYDQAFGKFDYPQGQINFSNYNTVHERADGMGRHVLVNTLRVGFSGTDTPIFENFYAGGFSSMRGFRFRGASPKEGGVQVGGRFMFLGSLEYMFPLTADEMLRGVAFVDYGTVERDITMTEENFRVAPGLGIRVSVPMLGPAPLAFDFAVPVAKADGDEEQVLSFFMGWTR